MLVKPVIQNGEGPVVSGRLLPTATSCPKWV